MRWCFSCAILVLGFLVVVMFWCFVLVFLCWCSSGVFVRSLGCLRSSGRKTQPRGKLSKMKFEHIRREDHIRSKNLSLTKEGSPHHFSAEKCVRRTSRNHLGVQNVRKFTLHQPLVWCRPARSFLATLLPQCPMISGQLKPQPSGNAGEC